MLNMSMWSQFEWFYLFGDIALRVKACWFFLMMNEQSLSDGRGFLFTNQIFDDFEGEGKCCAWTTRGDDVPILNNIIFWEVLDVLLEGMRGEACGLSIVQEAVFGQHHSRGGTNSGDDLAFRLMLFQPKKDDKYVRIIRDPYEFRDQLKSSKRLTLQEVADSCRGFQHQAYHQEER